MEKVKAIKNYRTVRHGYTEDEIPVADAESQVIMELNFNQFISVLAEVLVEYATDGNLQNFKSGQVGVAYLYLHVQLFCFFPFINKHRKVVLNYGISDR